MNENRFQPKPTAQMALLPLLAPILEARFTAPALLFWQTENAAHVETIAQQTGFSPFTITSNDDDSHTLQPGFHLVNRTGYALLDMNALPLFESEPYFEIVESEDDGEEYDADGDGSPRPGAWSDFDSPTDPDEMSASERDSRTIKAKNPACCSKNHLFCRGELWKCDKCARLFCEEEGADNGEATFCDECNAAAAQKPTAQQWNDRVFGRTPAAQPD